MNLKLKYFKILLIFSFLLVVYSFAISDTAEAASLAEMVICSGASQDPCSHTSSQSSFQYGDRVYAYNIVNNFNKGDTIVFEWVLASYRSQHYYSGLSRHESTWTADWSGSYTCWTPSWIPDRSGDWLIALYVNDVVIYYSELFYVNAPPVSVTVSSSGTTGTVPFSVNFYSYPEGGTGGYTYSWVFDDGGTSSSSNPTHTYNSAGSYWATLTVTDNSGISSSPKYIQIQVNDPLSVDISASSYSGVIPFTVSFSSDVSGGTSPYSYSWDFGDGSSSSSSNPSHTYSNSGYYTASLTVTDSDQDSDSDSKYITVMDPLSVSFSASPTSGFTPLTVDFKSIVTGCAIPYTYYWDFGDGFASYSSDPTHTYGSSGTYSVSLRVDSGGYYEIAYITIEASISIYVLIFLGIIVVVIPIAVFIGYYYKKRISAKVAVDTKAKKPASASTGKKPSSQPTGSKPIKKDVQKKTTEKTKASVDKQSNKDRYTKLLNNLEEEHKTGKVPDDIYNKLKKEYESKIK